MKYYIIGIEEDGSFQEKAIVPETMLAEAISSLQLEYPDKEVKSVELNLEELVNQLNIKKLLMSHHVV